MPEMNVELQKAYIETSRGRRLMLADPVYDVLEIAHSLSFLCRYTGHCKRFYSVAEHSLLVADIMARLGLGDPFEGLMHDATESVLADINSPIKHTMLPDYREAEAHFDRALRKQFGLPPEITAGCKRADWIALCIEAAELLPTGGRAWNMPEGVREQARLYKPHWWQDTLGLQGFKEVERNWLDQFYILTEKRA